MPQCAAGGVTTVKPKSCRIDRDIQTPCAGMSPSSHSPPFQHVDKGFKPRHQAASPLCSSKLKLINGTRLLRRAQRAIISTSDRTTTKRCQMNDTVNVPIQKWAVAPDPQSGRPKERLNQAALPALTKAPGTISAVIGVTPKLFNRANKSWLR